MPIHLRSKYKIITTLADFPAPSGGVITLEDDTLYEISGTVDISTNRIACGTRNIIRGFDRSNDKLVSTTTGALITCDSSAVVKTIVTCENLSLECTTGSLFALTGTAGNTQNLVVISCTILGFDTLGTLATCNAVVFRNTTIAGPIATGGFTITGTGPAASFLVLRDCSFRGCAGTMWNLGTSVWGEVQIDRNIITTAAAQTFLDGAAAGANVTIAGCLGNNIFTGAGTYVNTIVATDALWTWTDNVGVTNDAVSASVTATTVETNIGSTAKWSGKFTITDAAIGPTSKVLCWQAPGPYTNKGTRADEAEMQPVQVIAVEPASGSAVVKWQTPPMIVESPLHTIASPLGGGTAANSGTNRNIPTLATRIGKVRGNVKFSYSIFA